MPLRRTISFGSRVGIGWLRFVQLILLTAFVIGRPQPSEPTWSWIGVVPFLLVEIMLSYVVQGRLTSDGFEYRRWGKWRTLTWLQIESVSEHGLAGTISIKRIDSPIWSRYLLLGRPKPSLTSATDDTEGAVMLKSLISK
jgi:hypothetical protein